MTEPQEETRLERLMRGLKPQGIEDEKVLHAVEYTPRDLFVPELFLDRSWEDSAIPINCGQTISQPYIVALMTQALKIEGRHRVLEIGTGSGYQTAILARMARYVYTIERYRSLMVEAEIANPGTLRPWYMLQPSRPLKSMPMSRPRSRAASGIASTCTW